MYKMKTGIIYISTSKTSNKSYIGRDINNGKRKYAHKNRSFDINVG